MKKPKEKAVDAAAPVKVKRCEFYDEKKTRCRDEAEPGQVFCAKHRRSRQPR